MFSWELLNDSSAFEEELKKMLAKAISRGLDQQILRGVDAGGPTSILSHPSLITVAKSAGESAGVVNFDNIAAMYAQQLDHDGAVWVANRSLLPTLLKLAIPVGTGGAAVSTPVLSESPGDGSYKVLGKKLLLHDSMSGNGSVFDIGYFNFGYYALGRRAEITIQTTDADRWSQRERSVRALIRCDGTPTLETPVTPDQGDSLSPFLTLAARA